MRIFYTILLYFLQPFVCMRLFLKSRKNPDYRKRFSERYGFCKNKVKPNGILIHSVSVGETIAAIPLVKKLHEMYPNLPITMTTMTPTGSERVLLTFENKVDHVYFPYDLPDSIHRFLCELKPKIVIIMETELWPNFIHALYKKNIPLLIANARLSERSKNRYKKLAKSTKKMLNEITKIAAQDKLSADRFLELGTNQNQIEITGSLKFDISLSEDLTKASQNWRENFGKNRLIWIAASTHENEEEIILQTHQKLLQKYKNLLLILVPRHKERFLTVAELIKKNHFNFIKRSENPTNFNEISVFLCDSIGELPIFIGASNITFIGGSLIPRGGHNPLEAALFSLPILSGEYVFNFQSIYQEFKQKNAVIFVNENNIFEKINELIEFPERCKFFGENAKKVLNENHGSLKKIVKIIDDLLKN